MAVSYKLNIDTWKSYCRNDGEVKFFADEKQFLKYLREILGNDFADIFVETTDAEELYYEVYEAVEDTDLLEIGITNPVFMLKRYRKDYELLKKCLKFLEGELDYI